MTPYLIHETMNCQVTFVRRINAVNEEDAMDGAYDGDGDLLGVSIGDAVAGHESTKILPDQPNNIPAEFYPETGRDTS
jgi:hypothetical protein